MESQRFLKKRFCMKIKVFPIMIVAVLVFAGLTASAENRCYYYYKNMEYDRALEECTRAINTGDKKDNELYEYYTTRGIIYKIKGKYDEALSDLNSAIESGTESKAQLSFTYNDRGIVYQKKGQYNKAISDFYQAIYLNPASFTGMYNIARAFSLINRADLACKWLQKSRENGFSVLKQAVQKEKSFRNIRNAQCYRKIMAGK
jgi:tetratricopeptide (TPR) repeat protein